MFGQHGFGLGLREIAAEAGVTAGSVTYHFGGKTGFLAACDRQVLDGARIYLPAVMASGEREVQLRGNDRTHLHLLRYLMRSLAESTALVEPFIEILVDATRTEVLAHFQAEHPDPGCVDTAARDVIRRTLGVAMLDHALTAPTTAEELQAMLTSWRNIGRDTIAVYRAR